ncbi:MAG TPA: patatin-like phospholipase family protein [Chitinophagaceae bacterium]|nr:patatin-like phospholipase family protein [Chitinophagaceae bacterium]
MKKYLVGVFYSLPVQLALLHLRRYQVLLIFWYILFATISGNFLETYGANSLYLAPEYLNRVDALSTAIVGFSIAIFIMSWNITTFILHAKYIKFLATTAQPFLKYCINNALIPLVFVITYIVYACRYARYQELMDTGRIIILTVSSLLGFALSIAIAAIYFYNADKTIYRRMQAVLTSANLKYEKKTKRRRTHLVAGEMRVDWFLSAKLQLRKPRIIRHYSQQFLDSIFKRHHIAAVLIVLLAFVSLIGIGYFSESKLFQFPAAASITVFFAILIAAAGAITLFLRSWAIPVLFGVLVLFNWLYKENIIDPTNKAYGLNYLNRADRPAYDQTNVARLINADSVAADVHNYLQILDRWKTKQHEDKPVMFIVDVSGGGIRSASFTMNVLQALDSITNGLCMQHTALINGASGGMLGAAYFRQLYWEKLQGTINNLDDKQYANDISKDLLNPLFASFVSRDIMGPVKKFRVNGNAYSKDRGYAFEQKLNENTHGVLNKKLGDYAVAEQQAVIPSMFFNSTINRDGRQMIISSQHVRFLMTHSLDSSINLPADPDAIDFTAFFQKQNPYNLHILSALRMNATFPYVLPNVALPSNPVISVMDAGLRDNFGQSTSLRFITTFRDWLQENTSKVVLIQIRDRKLGGWDSTSSSTVGALDFITQPLLILQNNWYKLQEYYQGDQVAYLSQLPGLNFKRVIFEYQPESKNSSASLSFHLTAAEKVDIAAALYNTFNQRSFKEVKDMLNKQ